MPLSPPRVLLVEDEPAQAEVLRYNLVTEGYDVVVAETGDAALLALEEQEIALILLDWMLPGVSGIEICRRVKARKDRWAPPIIMISARSEEGDLVRGLETGADDYVYKPYSMRELMARVRAQLRKANQTGAGTTFEHRGIVLDGDTHRVTRDGDVIKLGPTEFRLLALLIARPEQVWSRAQLLDRIWDQQLDIESRTVDVHIGRLRRALRTGGKPDPIRTVRGEGYALL